jgi:hypothetical protein
MVAKEPRVQPIINDGVRVVKIIEAGALRTHIRANIGGWEARNVPTAGNFEHGEWSAAGNRLGTVPSALTIAKFQHFLQGLWRSRASQVRGCCSLKFGRRSAGFHELSEEP